jgi:DNA-binding transcriptional LysR family regulator
MNLRFVEAFYWVATLKSVSRAAEKLFLTQSAMSARIAALEEEMGALLLDRQEKQVRLTAAGVRFLTYAQKFLELQREVKAQMGATWIQIVSATVVSFNRWMSCDTSGFPLRPRNEKLL